MSAGPAASRNSLNRYRRKNDQSIFLNHRCIFGGCGVENLPACRFGSLACVAVKMTRSTNCNIALLMLTGESNSAVWLDTISSGDIVVVQRRKVTEKQWKRQFSRVSRLSHAPRKVRMVFFSLSYFPILASEEKQHRDTEAVPSDAETTTTTTLLASTTLECYYY